MALIFFFFFNFNCRAQTVELAGSWGIRASSLVRMREVRQGRASIPPMSHEGSEHLASWLQAPELLSSQAALLPGPLVGAQRGSGVREEDFAQK